MRIEMNDGAILKTECTLFTRRGAVLGPSRVGMKQRYRCRNQDSGYTRCQAGPSPHTSRRLSIKGAVRPLGELNRLDIGLTDERLDVVNSPRVEMAQGLINREHVKNVSHIARRLFKPSYKSGSMLS